MADENKSNDDKTLPRRSSMHEQKKHHLHESLDSWFEDTCTLVQSPEFSRFAKSTLNLAVSTTSTITKICLLPITFPLHVTCSVTNTTASIISETFLQHKKKDEKCDINANTSCSKRQPAKVIFERIMHVSRVGLLWSFAERCAKDTIQVINHQGSRYNLSEHNFSLFSSSDLEIFDENKKQVITNYFLPIDDLNMATMNSTEFSDHRVPNDMEQKSRGKDEQGKRLKNQLSIQMERDYDPILYIEIQTRSSARSPYEIESVFDSFMMQIALRNISEDAIQLARTPISLSPSSIKPISTNDYSGLKFLDPKHETHKKFFLVEWNPANNTGKLLKQLRRQFKNKNQQYLQKTTLTHDESMEIINLQENNVLMWTGNPKELPSKGQNRYHIQGYDIPFFKGQGIIHASPESILKLLLDSSRVSEYNKHAMGRYDVAILENKLLSHLKKKRDSIGKYETDNKIINEYVETRIVESETNIPFSKFSIPFLTLLHARKLCNEEGYLIITRSMLKQESDDPNTKRESDNEKHIFSTTTALDESYFEQQENEIIWGVNLLRAVKGFPNKTELTTVSQVKSSIIPKFLVEKIGTMCILEFFTNLRQLYTLERTQ